MSEQRSAWAMGYATFAGVILVIAGVVQAFVGLVGIFENEGLFVVNEEWIVEFDATTWGVVHLIIGALLVLAGVGIFTGNVLARTVGVVVAGLSAIANFMWLPYYPVWSVVIIALDIAIIWALTAHGRDLATSRAQRSEH